ncbi:hypothetical protein MHYP_G00281040 [Metynnis hypsauchen]
MKTYDGKKWRAHAKSIYCDNPRVSDSTDIVRWESPSSGCRGKVAVGGGLNSLISVELVIGKIIRTDIARQDNGAVDVNTVNELCSGL